MLVILMQPGITGNVVYIGHNSKEYCSSRFMSEAMQEVVHHLCSRMENKGVEVRVVVPVHPITHLQLIFIFLDLSMIFP